ncbi:hypothetical protein NDU88_009423 [Pleurodeles waltl]|uniref:Uncharacterized protein n=1 Tax=Pleurodeles waltl TaxID=8319 RepID=A0AAV7QRH9_PLEWA|nr:hypothetical protein NDU88_009423 [Pleurodeles waltl]
MSPPAERPGPSGPGGVTGRLSPRLRTVAPEVISDTDIWVTTPSVEEDESPEERCAAGETEEDADEEKTKPGPKGETRSEKEEEGREDEEIREIHEQCCHVPGGVWLTQEKNRTAVQTGSRQAKRAPRYQEP